MAGLNRRLGKSSLARNYVQYLVTGFGLGTGTGGQTDSGAELALFQIESLYQSGRGVNNAQTPVEPKTLFRGATIRP